MKKSLLAATAALLSVAAFAGTPLKSSCRKRSRSLKAKTTAPVPVM